MDGLPLIDTSFDFRIDSAGRDPDKYSPTLRRYHRLLWSKPLPGGEMFALEDGGGYLRHSSHLGEFFLSSDSVTPTFTKYKRMQHLVEQFTAEDNEAFATLASTLGRGPVPGSDYRVPSHEKPAHPAVEPAAPGVRRWSFQALLV